MNYFKLKNPAQDDPDGHFEDGWIKFTFSDDEDQSSDYYIDCADTIQFDKVDIKINDVVYTEQTPGFRETFNALLAWHKLNA